MVMTHTLLKDNLTLFIMKNKLTICKKDLCISTYGKNAQFLKALLTIVIVTGTLYSTIRLIKQFK